MTRHRRRTPGPARAIPHPASVPIAALVTTVSLIGIGLGVTGCDAPETSGLGWIRRGTVYIDVPDRARLDVMIEPTHGPADYAYLSRPDGRTLVRKRLEPEHDGRMSRELTAPGTYRLIPSPSHRMRVTAEGGRLTFEPEREFPSLHLKGRESFVFEVPEACPGFTLSATNQHDWEGSPGAVRLFDPSGDLVHTFTFDALDQDGILARLGITREQAEHYRAQGDTAEVPEFRLLIERHRIDAPRPGLWRVEAEITGSKPDDIGFWLDDPEHIPNLFSPVGGRPMAPVFPVATATVRVDLSRVLGPTGEVGAVWSWTVEQSKALEVYRRLGLRGSKHFFPQVDMEATNDDDDPAHFQWDGFTFAPFLGRLDVYRDQPIPMSALMTISRIAPWARGSLAEITEYAEACVRYHQIEAGLDPSRLYWQFLNEPNHEVSLADYVAAFRASGERLKANLDPDGTTVTFGGPGTGNASGDREALPWQWISRLITDADDVLDFVVWNQYRLGRIEDTWRYRQHITFVDSLLSVHDSDGRREEIIIGATNLRGGIVLQNERQDGAYSAIWWPSVLCQTLGTGRCRLINYFFLIDQGARRKGLLREDWSEKPVAWATAFFNAFRGDSVLATTSDHDGVDVLAMRSWRPASDPGRPPGPELTMVVVNKTPNPIEVQIEFTGEPAGEWIPSGRLELRSLDVESGARHPGRTHLDGSHLDESHLIGLTPFRENASLSAPLDHDGYMPGHVVGIRSLPTDSPEGVARDD